MKFRLFIVLNFLFISNSTNAQSYFIETFDNPEILNPNSDYWEQMFSMVHTNPQIDINQNGITDSIELIKNHEIITDIDNVDNTILKITLNRADLDFYTTYKCSSENLDNLYELDSIDNYYDANYDAYCVGCQESPNGTSNAILKNLLNRNEFSTKNSAEQSFANDQFHWFSFKVKLDEDYQLDNTINPEIIAQWHIDEGVETNLPPVSLNIEQGRWVLKLRPLGQTTNWIDQDLGPVEKDEWVKWTFRLKLAANHKRSRVYIYKNDLLLHHIKSKYIKGLTPYYFKFGIYKSQWWNCGINTHATSNTKVLYFDDVWANNRNKAPHVSLIASNKNKVLGIHDMNLMFDWYDQYTYKFKIVDSLGNKYFLENNDNDLNLFFKSWIQPRMKYKIYVKLPGHELFYKYRGFYSTFYTNGLLNQVVPEDFDKIISTIDSEVSVFEIPSVDNYKFRIKDLSTNQIRFHTSSTNSINFNDFNWATPNTSYQIWVRLTGHAFMDSYSTVVGTVHTASDYNSTANASRPSLATVDKFCELQLINKQLHLVSNENETIHNVIVYSFNGQVIPLAFNAAYIDLSPLKGKMIIVQLQTSSGIIINKKLMLP